MAGHKEMNEEERSVFALHGLVGGLIATLLLVSVFAILTYFAITVQQENAENFYKIDRDIHVIKAGSTFSEGDQQDGSENYKQWVNVK
ncbi:MAG: DUF4006 family protein [Campylobacterota bacterium]|nr:DUF4006 family protein [Campylobacterota bacterium]